MAPVECPNCKEDSAFGVYVVFEAANGKNFFTIHRKQICPNCQIVVRSRILGFIFIDPYVDGLQVNMFDEHGKTMQSGKIHKHDKMATRGYHNAIDLALQYLKKMPQDLMLGWIAYFLEGLENLEGYVAEHLYEKIQEILTKRLDEGGW